MPTEMRIGLLRYFADRETGFRPRECIEREAHGRVMLQRAEQVGGERILQQPKSRRRRVGSAKPFTKLSGRSSPERFQINV